MNSKKSILLVEDDLDISEAIQSILEEEGFNLKCLFNGKEAIDYLRDTLQMPDLILLDIMMPHMNGYQFRELQLKDGRLASIPTIILSAAGKCDDLAHYQFRDCLKKPLDLETLIEVVHRNTDEALRLKPTLSDQQEEQV